MLNPNILNFGNSSLIAPDYFPVLNRKASGEILEFTFRPCHQIANLTPRKIAISAFCLLLFEVKLSFHFSNSHFLLPCPGNKSYI